MTTDLEEIVRAHLAEKVRLGKRWTKADLEMLAAITEPAQPYSSIEGARNAKGDMQFGGKVYAIDPYEAERILKDILNRMRATYPMRDGTVGSPMVSADDPHKSAAIAANVAKAKAAKS